MKLLVPLDGSQLAERALDHAAAFARRFDSEVHVLHVIEKVHIDTEKPFDGLDWEFRCAHIRSYLEQVRESLASQMKVECHVTEGDPAVEIVEFCRQQQIDLLMLSAYGAGGKTRFPRGGTVQKVIGSAEVSLLLVSSASMECRGEVEYRHILAPLDGSQRAEWALRLAAAIARSNNARLSLLRVVQEPKISQAVLESVEGRQLYDRLMELNCLDAARGMEELKAALPREQIASSRLISAPEIAPVIEEVAAAEDVDLLVLSAHGIAPDGYWLYGPVTETVLAHTNRSVLILQDAQKRGFFLKPVSGTPTRSERRETRQRAEAS